MKKLSLFATLLTGVFGASAAPVEYVRICSLFGAGYHYIPGTDVCVNDATGQTRQETVGGTWTALLPTSTPGEFVGNLRQECAQGRLVRVGTVKPSDFKINAFETYQVAPVPFRLQRGEFISKVMMSGGFYDPLQPLAHVPQLSMNQQLCLRVADPTLTSVDMGGPPTTSPFCSNVPLGCVSNTQLLGTPATYAFPVLGSPVVRYNTDINGRVVGAAQTCGSQLVLTTGMGRYNPTVTTDPSQPGVPIPAGGTISTWICVMSQNDSDDR